MVVLSTSLPSPLPPASPLGDHRPGVGRMELLRTFGSVGQGWGLIKQGSARAALSPPAPIRCSPGPSLPRSPQTVGEFFLNSNPEKSTQFFTTPTQKIEIQKTESY